MAVEVNAVAVTAPLEAALVAGVVPWQVNATSADASGCEQLVAAPGSGKALVVTRLIIYLGAAITATIGAGKSGTAVEAVVVGPLGGAAGTYDLDCRTRPIVIAANKALTVDTSGAGALCVYVEGYTK